METAAGRRTILHLDLDAFFCAVEELRDPALAGKAFAVGGSPEGRGVVASCSYPARIHGVRSAMPMARALALCPGLIVVRHTFGSYRSYSEKVMAALRALGGPVEQISIDEAFVDITGLRRSPADLATRLQHVVRNEIGLPCSIGIAGSKLVAKMASEEGKAAGSPGAYPNALRIVAAGSEQAFLAPLPASRLWGVGPKTAARLGEIGIATVGDIATRAPSELAGQFGRYGLLLWQHARGVDDREIVTFRERKSVSRESTFERDVTDGDRLRALLREQAGWIAAQLRKERLRGSVVGIKIRWPDFTTLTRQRSLGGGTDDAEEIAAVGLALFAKIWTRGRAVRLLGLGVGNVERPMQLSLFDQRLTDEAERDQRLADTITGLKRRFGSGAIRKADDLARIMLVDPKDGV